MNKSLIILLKLVIAVIGVTVLAGMVIFPQTEGRATGLDLVSIYTDPFIIYGYIASIPFFVALYQAFKLLGHIKQNEALSPIAIKALGNIKYCALAMIGFLVGALLYIRIVVQGDDPAGPTMLGLIAIIISAVVVIAITVFQKKIQNATDLQPKQELAA